MCRFKCLKAENNRLYNEVQDLKGNIRVFCRVRPAGCTGDDSTSCLQAGLDGALAVYDAKMMVNGQPTRKIYRFDRVYRGNSTQLDVYEDLQPLTRSVMDGEYRLGSIMIALSLVLTVIYSVMDGELC